MTGWNHFYLFSVALPKIAYMGQYHASTNGHRILVSTVYASMAWPVNLNTLERNIHGSFQVRLLAPMLYCMRRLTDYNNLGNCSLSSGFMAVAASQRQELNLILYGTIVTSKKNLGKILSLAQVFPKFVLKYFVNRASVSYVSNH